MARWGAKCLMPALTLTLQQPFIAQNETDDQMAAFKGQSQVWTPGLSAPQLCSEHWAGLSAEGNGGQCAAPREHRALPAGDS